VGPRAGMDVEAKISLFTAPCQETNPGRLARSLATIVTELPRLLKAFLYFSKCLGKGNDSLLSKSGLSENTNLGCLRT
jgi:hypothetical protein